MTLKSKDVAVLSAALTSSCSSSLKLFVSDDSILCELVEKGLSSMFVSSSVVAVRRYGRLPTGSECWLSSTNLRTFKCPSLSARCLFSRCGKLVWSGCWLSSSLRIFK
ncbi:hypothetical protein Mapa_013157 [Marchantia paleacea]|nr:hypothetical protein Mapa_013157 [Marchantia paleacea]